jgi:hypothetical protein
VASNGARVQLAGVAAPALDGDVVKIIARWDGATVATARVEGGAFSTTARLPRRRLRDTNRARYEAIIPGVAYSPALKLTRRLHATRIELAGLSVGQGGKLTISGRVTGPLPAKHHPLLLTSQDPASCAVRSKVVARLHIGPRGRFSAHVALPADDAPIVYRLQTLVAARAHGVVAGSTYTLPLAVNVAAPGAVSRLPRATAGPSPRRHHHKGATAQTGTQGLRRRGRALARRL